jgi:alanyl-tRNA synthetase
VFESKGFDGRVWASKVADVLGGKVRIIDLRLIERLIFILSGQAGGKADGAQGVGINVDKVEEAVEVAKGYFNSYINEHI